MKFENDLLAIFCKMELNTTSNLEWKALIRGEGLRGGGSRPSLGGGGGAARARERRRRSKSTT